MWMVASFVVSLLKILYKACHSCTHSVVECNTNWGISSWYSKDYYMSGLQLYTESVSLPGQENVHTTIAILIHNLDSGINWFFVHSYGSLFYNDVLFIYRLHDSYASTSIRRINRPPPTIAQYINTIWLSILPIHAQDHPHQQCVG